LGLFREIIIKVTAVSFTWFPKGIVRLQT